jgi:hypothetical protein
MSTQAVPRLHDAASSPAAIDQGLQSLLDTTSAIFSLCKDSPLYTPAVQRGVQTRRATQKPRRAGSFWERYLDQSRM